jgi:acyl-ACP thioesterase
MLDEPMVPLPEVGRVFRGARRVRLGDTDHNGQLRLDACARFLQDVSNDDTADAGEDPKAFWVVRRAVVDVVRPPTWREWVDLATWCGGTGSRWAERRLSLTGDHGGHIEVATLWIYVDAATMAPARLPDSFAETYAPAARGRKVKPRRTLGAPDDDAVTVAWPLRAVDLDLLGHVTNSAYWAPVEEMLRGGPASLRGERHPLLATPYRAVMEFGAGIAPDAEVELRVCDADDRLALWFAVGGTVDAAALVVPLPGQ